MYVNMFHRYVVQGAQVFLNSGSNGARNSPLSVSMWSSPPNRLSQAGEGYHLLGAVDWVWTYEYT